MSKSELEIRQERRQIYEAGLAEGHARCVTALMIAGMPMASEFCETHVDVHKFEAEEIEGAQASELHGVRSAPPDVGSSC